MLVELMRSYAIAKSEGNHEAAEMIWQTIKKLIEGEK